MYQNILLLRVNISTSSPSLIPVPIVNDMLMAVKCDLRLYTDDTFLVFQSKNIKDIEKQLNKDFANICDWFVGNKLSIYFGEDKTKSILFASKRKIRKLQKL